MQETLDLWSAQQVADRYDVPVRAVYRAVKLGRLPSLKINNWVLVFKPEDLPERFPRAK